MTIKEVWDKAKTKGDVATVLIFGAAGFVVDAATTLHGVISPGYFAGSAAAAALGAKNGIEAWADSSKRKKTERSLADTAKTRAERAVAELGSNPALRKEVTRLENEIVLFEKGFSSIEQLEKATEEFFNAYRKSDPST